MVEVGCYRRAGLDRAEMNHDLLFHLASAIISAIVTGAAVYVGLDRRITRMETKMELIFSAWKASLE